MSLYHYVYISQATEAYNTEELNAILVSARNFNQENAITGMLLYCKSSFMQLLEGSKEDIYSLMDQRISKDKRHHTIYVVKEAEVKERSFSEWSMGFSNLEQKEPSQLKGYTQFLDKGFTSELISSDLDVTHNLLLGFRGT